MSKPSTSTVPFTRASGTSSCMRLRQRTKVDLPHPEGPIIAVTECGSTERLISKSACLRPYQASRCCTVKVISCSLYVTIFSDPLDEGSAGEIPERDALPGKAYALHTARPIKEDRASLGRVPGSIDD